MHKLSIRHWQELERAHVARADRLTAGHLERRSRGQAHPVEDFLWTYYSLKPSHLRRWHPGAGILLQGAGEASSGDPPRSAWRFYAAAGADLFVDAPAFVRARGRTIEFVRRLLQATAERPGQFGCFGMHEWAMVYRLQAGEERHPGVPLRLSNGEVDDVVESHQLRCTHIDAFRFFTPDAAPRNSLRLTRDSQLHHEQPGCLHAGMDLYKWAGKLGPLIPGELLLDTFELARDIREVDMRASPYDVSAYRGQDGEHLEPIPIETARGKRVYVELQREFAARADPVRTRLLEAIDVAEAAARVAVPTGGGPPRVE